MGSKAHRNTLTKAMEILYTIVNNFPSQLSDKNILNIYSISTKIIKSNTDFVVKNKLFELLLLCFQKVDGCLENNDSTIVYKDLLNSLRTAVMQKHSESGKCTIIF